GTVLQTRTAVFELHPGAARLSIRSRDGAVHRDVDLSLVVDGTAQSLALARDDLRSVAGALRAAGPVSMGDSSVDATLEFRADLSLDAVSVVLLGRPGLSTRAHTVALRAELPTEGQVVFASGIGQLEDR